MIRIRVDPYGLSKDDPTALIVQDESQFIDSRLKIRDALHEKKDLNVIIKNRKIGRWYESLKDYQDVKMETVSPSSVLSQKLNLLAILSLNLPVSDPEIKELGLIEKAKKYPPQIRLTAVGELENWMLSVCVGKCLAVKGGTLTHLAEIASFFLGRKEYQRHPALRRLIDKKKKEWFNSSIGKVYKWLFTDFNERAFLIYAWQILKNYDNTVSENILYETLETNRIILEPIEKCLDRIPPIVCSDNYKKKSDFSILIEMKWKNILKSTFGYKKSEIRVDKNKVLKQKFEQVINEAITKVSGGIVGEINALLVFVKENAFFFSKKLFNLIGAKFSQFPDKIEELSKFIPRKFPSKPKLNWNWSQMSRWVIDEYFPYKKWSIQQNRRDKKIEEIAETYSQWLYMKYPELKNELSPLIYGSWYRIKRYIEQGFQIIWIIIDNLCWFYTEDVIRAFKEQKLYCSSKPTPCLSMLPSETRISKTALVAGRLPNQIEVTNYQKYKLLFEDFCKQNNIVRHRAILDREFRKSKLEKHQVTCCIINKLDVSSHGGFFDLEDEIKDFLRRIAKYIKEFLSPCLVSKKFKLVISTDHGSCTIPQNIKGLKAPKGARAEKEHKRFVYIDSTHNLNKNWYFLDKNKFGLMEGIAIAKGYNFVGNRKPKGLVHGGMTPEETLVPHLEFCLQPLEIRDIQCLHISAPIPIGIKKQKVELEIQNPNDKKIYNAILFIPSNSLEINIGTIPERNYVTKSIEIALPKKDVIIDKDNTVTLQGFYSFYCLGEPKRGKIEVKINIRRIIAVSETAEELFNI